MSEQHTGGLAAVMVWISSIISWLYLHIDVLISRTAGLIAIALGIWQFIRIARRERHRWRWAKQHKQRKDNA